MKGDWRAPMAAIVLALCALVPTNLHGATEVLLKQKDVEDIYQRAIQLTEATMLTIPGLGRAAEPLLENCRQAATNTRLLGQIYAPSVYLFLNNLRAYLQLAAALPKPQPFPPTAQQQFEELRKIADQLEGHFQALLEDLYRRLRDPDPNQVGYYAEQNAKLSPPRPDRPRVVFLGDSITQGWPLNEYFPDRDFINRGISGQTTSQMLGRMQTDVIQLRPAAVVIHGGTNDLARGVPLEIIQNNLRMMATLAEANGIKVILASLLPVHDYNKDQDPRYERTRQRPPRRIVELNDWLRAFCKERRYGYVDYHSRMVDANGLLRADLSDDGLHPNPAGYRVMAPAVLEVIDRLVPAGPAGRPRQGSSL